MFTSFTMSTIRTRKEIGIWQKSFYIAETSEMIAKGNLPAITREKF
jgi:hypothetical protein